MRIQGINLFANKVVNRQSNQNQFYKINQLQTDTVSFSGKPAETSSIVKTKIEAEKIQQRAEEVKTQAEEYALEGYDILEETKQSFIQALKYIDMARMAAANNTVNFELADGRSLNFISILKNGKPHPLMIKVYDKNNENIQNITVKDFVPNHIEEFNNDGTLRSMDFNGDNSIIVMDDVAPTEGNKIGSMYVFNNGLLMAVRKNRNLVVQPMVDEKCFYYNEQGDLWLAEENTQMHLVGKRVVEDRYNFLNGKLYNYYSNFEKSPEDLMSWDESYHYDQYKFIGQAENVKQYGKGKIPIAENAIYLDNRKFVEAEDVECKINDYAAVEFKESK